MTKKAQVRAGRAYGIVIENPKFAVNTGTLMRTAVNFGASCIITIGGRYRRQPSDTLKSTRHVPLLRLENWDVFQEVRPYDWPLIGVEIDDHSQNLLSYTHPHNALYVLGAEDHGLTAQARSLVQGMIQIPSYLCLNVAIAGAIVMYDRFAKNSR